MPIFAAALLVCGNTSCVHTASVPSGVLSKQILTFENTMVHTYPLRFENNLVTTIWGGSHLKPLKGMKADGELIGESWEVSDVAGHVSVVRNGILAGHTLDEVIHRWGPALLGQRIYKKYRGKCPLLVKLIDAAHDLSIQVHPDDVLAAKRHGTLGKTEMWYVLSAEPGSTLLTGFREALSADDYSRRVADGTIVDALARQSVQPGDVFFIPAGRVHAICGGIVVCEIQQSSDITYRLWDYGRMGLDGRPRELHVELARDAIDFGVYADYRTRYEPAKGATTLVDCPCFVASLLQVENSLERRLSVHDSCVTLTCIEGVVRIVASGDKVTELPTGASCLIPAVDADYRIEGRARLLEAWAR